MISLIVRLVLCFRSLCFILFQHSMCVYVSECVRVCVAVNSHACLFCFSLCRSILVFYVTYGLCMFVCSHD